MAAPRPGTKWGGRQAQEARAWLARNTTWPTVCAVCGELVYSEEAWELGHILARELRPELTWEPTNWRVEHGRCSASGGHAVAAAKRAALQPALFPGGPAVRTELRPPSLPPMAQPEPIAAREELAWNPEYLARFDWLQPLLDVPADAAVPLMMSPVPDDAVGTYGWLAVEWIERTQRIKLRWWQKLSTVRQYEHRADGSLCWRVEIESGPRRIGKSTRIRGTALWRMDHAQAELAPPFGVFTPFGEVQNVIHTGNQLKICREIQRGAWRWAEGQGWQVTRANGKEAIETPAGDRWMVFAQDGVYGYDVCYGIVDESWDVKPDTVTEGLEPAMLERINPQLLATSTAHRRATSLMRKYLAAAMTGDDPTVLLLLWGAPAGADPGDPDVWKAASPHWSEDRRAMIAAKYEKALAGQADPEFDDPDPMRGFEAQYLNVWRINEPVLPGLPVVSEIGWAELTSLAPDRVPDAVAVESWYGHGVTVAAAWNADDGRAIVATTDHPDLADAIAHAATLRCRRPVIVGATLAADLGWKDAKVRVTPKTTAARVTVGELQRLLAEAGFTHTDAGPLTAQVLALRVVQGVDGPGIRSAGRLDAIRAAMWAITDATTHPRRKVVLPSRYA